MQVHTQRPTTHQSREPTNHRTIKSLARGAKRSCKRHSIAKLKPNRTHDGSMGSSSSHRSSLKGGVPPDPRRLWMPRDLTRNILVWIIEQDRFMCKCVALCEEVRQSERWGMSGGGVFNYFLYIFHQLYFIFHRFLTWKIYMTRFILHKILHKFAEKGKKEKNQI